MPSIYAYKNLTPRYVFTRLCLAIYLHNRPDVPWLDPTIVGLLNDLIREDQVGLEVRAGRSTVWFAERCARLISIEHNEEWSRKVKERLKRRGLSDRVDVRLVQDRKGNRASSYVQAVQDLPDNSIDFVLIDGKKRDACALSALPKVRPGGLIIVDDIHRYLPAIKGVRRPPGSNLSDQCATELWTQFASAVAQWRCIRRSNGIYETAFWIKPCN